VAWFASAIHGAPAWAEVRLHPLACRIPRQRQKIRKISEINPAASGRPGKVSILFAQSEQEGDERDFSQGVAALPRLWACFGGFASLRQMIGMDARGST
jgi:hypothetical protein